VLIENLAAFLEQKPLVKYTPQEDFLKLILCGDGTALGFRFGVPLHGKWVMQLKNHIDTMFMSLFAKENLPDLEEGAAVDTSQYDAADINQVDRIHLPPEDAAELLQRSDDGVDYLAAWSVLRDMTKDEQYRTQVLDVMNEPAALLRG
jgi:selenide,water dikinase